MKRLLHKIYHIIAFPFYYLVQLISANLYLAYDILTPRMRINPGTIEVKMTLKSDFGLLVLSNLISMTPGTLSLDLDKENETLQVHTLYINKEAATRREIDQMMKRIKKITE